MKSAGRQSDRARGFTVEEVEGITKLTVFNPWEKANDVSFDYYLVNREKEIPSFSCWQKDNQNPG
jgi:hypothetical protein